MSKNISKRKALTISLSLLILTIITLISYQLITGRNTQSELTKWDGKHSTSFSSGNGTKENPFSIKSGNDLAFFKDLLEGTDAKIYNKMYYILDNDIDLNYIEFPTINSTFEGTFDGNGHTIYNLNITNTIKDNDNYYSLFMETKNSSFRNLNIDGLQITPKETDNNTNVSIFSYKSIVENKDEEDNSSLFYNISVRNININLDNLVFDNENIKNNIYLISNNIGEKVYLENIYIAGNITINNELYLINEINGEYENIFLNINKEYNTFKTNNTKESSKLYNFTKNQIYLNNEIQDTNNIIKEINKNIKPFLFNIIDNNLVLEKIIEENPELVSAGKILKSFSFNSSDITLHNSGVENNIIYINDLTSDYNYYIGLNYSDRKTQGTIPDGISNNKYNNSNLAKIYIRYSGVDFNDNSLVGYVGVDNNELISEYIYYKYYPIENGYISFELIDNPFANRPNGKVFNGWVTDYVGAEISLDTQRYIRSVRIPASSTGPISITFMSSWIPGDIKSTSSSNIRNTLNSMPDRSLRQITQTITTHDDVTGLYISGTINRWEYYPDGSVNEDNEDMTGEYCRTNGYGSNRTCTYYLKLTSNDYQEDETYYRLNYYDSWYYSYYYFTEVTINVTTTTSPVVYNSDMLTAGLYKKINLSRGQSQVGYYNSSGDYLSSGTCNSNNCEVYQYMNYYNSSNNYNIGDGTSNYYYLVTRDTNIIHITGEVTSSSNGGGNNSSISNSIPLTITGLNNGRVSNNAVLNIYNSRISADDDLRIEFIEIYSRQRESTNNLTSSGTASRYIYGNYHNIKIGRGITNSNTTYKNANAIIAGNASGTGSESNLTKYQMIVESGSYNYTSLTASQTYYNIALYVDGYAIYGSDFDRISNTNTKLDIYYSTAGNWGGIIRSNSSTPVNLHTTVKSGTFGSSEADVFSGIYVGGRSYGTVYAAREGIIEGGDIYNLIGGPLTDSSRETVNDTYIFIKGGTIDMVVGGAGLATTYGNRIISLTGGTVNYALFGGSNGYNGSDNGDSTQQGVLEGDTFIYVGGEGIVGNNSTTTLFGVESGSIFGAGNGNSSSTGVGTADNSRILIDGGTIRGNIYGGGNYGALGIRSETNTTNTYINVQKGTIGGSIYGGGNNNDSGSNSVTSQINITVSGGNINNIYGGSRTKGIVYGSTNVNVLSGTINNSVYGGGEGGYQSNSYPGTYVRDNVNVIIGSDSQGPTITGSVYGGSAFGTTNGTTRQGQANAALHTNVTVNNGTISGNVFGGAKGGTLSNVTYTPYVYGNITVNINNGNIGNVYGGFDAAGAPSGNDVVFLYGGTIGNAFGGGNSTGQTTTNIYLQGASVTNLFGGSNQTGTVNTTNVTMSSGTAGNVYGGNNYGGTATTTNVICTGGTISSNVYGGGNQAESTRTNVDVNGIISIDNVYGGGNQAGVSNSTNVNIAKGTINGVYGGSNQSGTVGTTNVNVGPNISNYYDDYSSEGSGLEVSFNYRFSSAQYQTDLYPEYKTIVDITPVFRSTIGEAYDEWSFTINVPDSTFYAHDGDANIIVNGETYTWNQDDRWWGTNPIPSGSTYSPSLPLRVLFKGTENDFRLIYDLEAIDGNNGIHKKTNDPNYLSPTQGGGINIQTIYGGNNIGGTVNISNVTINNGTIGEIYGGGNQVGLTTSNVEITGGNVTSVYGGSNRNGNVTTSNVTIGGESTLNITDVYGGNNLGGRVTQTNVTVTQSNISNLYGGGNQAPVGSTNLTIGNGTIQNLYGGGNAAEVTGNTLLDVDNATIPTNLYGGGNQGVVKGNTEVYITNSTVGGSIYAGGNGASATVEGNTTILVDGTTIVGSNTSTGTEGSIFGGGNAAATGKSANNFSKAVLNIAGGHIYGNVYGGANTSVVYGETFTNIGTAAINKYLTDLQASQGINYVAPFDVSNLEESNLIIEGIVFGGGEANASGSETYDWNFISVTEGIKINIDATNYSENSHEFKLKGSIFGSGNASSSSGPSEIYIKKLGTDSNPSKNISIQRTNLLTIDNSVIELSGIKDRTNEYSDIPYTFNMIDKMIIKNGTTLLLQKNANMLKELYSGVDSNGNLTTAKVTIDESTKTISKNVDNRIYMIPTNNLNVTTNPAATSYGKVTGMTFFGLYNAYSSGSYSYGMYGKDFTYGSSADASDAIIGGSYVLGLHSVNHDITKDGFYTNYLNDDFTEVKSDYIDPEEVGTNGYRWIVGTGSTVYRIYLTASKYSSLGTASLPIIDFAKGDTLYNVVGFNSEGLAAGTSLVDKSAVPKITDEDEDAIKTLGLSMKAETQEWTSYGTTNFLSTNNGTFNGTREYKTDNSPATPTLMFYLYHPKNISTNADLGTVVVSLQVLEPKNAIEYEVSLVTVYVEIDSKKSNDDDAYDASIAYGKKYEMPSSTDINITNQSQFSTYFSIIANANEIYDFYGNSSSYYHVLVTDYALPTGTQITMIDYAADAQNPEIYYYTITDTDYQNSLNELENENEVTYKLSNFIKMGSTSTNNKYNDTSHNQIYYDAAHKRVVEDFMFIFDMKNTTATGTHENNQMLFELRNEDDRAKVTVYGNRQTFMYYNLYDATNAVLEETITQEDNHLYQGIDHEFNLSTEIAYDETDNRQSIIDTNYESSAMGLNVYLYDSSNNQISSSMLLGTSIKMDRTNYFADKDGVWRIKLSGKVSNLVKSLIMQCDETLPIGQYTMKFVLFASSDGLHNASSGITSEVILPITVVGNSNAIKVEGQDEYKVVDGNTALNENDSRSNEYTIRYKSVLSNPSIRIKVTKRKTDTQTDTEYVSIPFNNLFSNIMSAQGTDNEVLLSSNPTDNMTIDLVLNEELVSGTYRIIFELYDNNQLIDSDYEYIIVKKDVS